MEQYPSVPMRKFSTALEESLIFFSLFLFGVGRLTDNVTPPTPPTTIETDWSRFLHFSWLASALGTLVKQILSFLPTSYNIPPALNQRQSVVVCILLFLLLFLDRNVN